MGLFDGFSGNLSGVQGFLTGALDFGESALSKAASITSSLNTIKGQAEQTFGQAKALGSSNPFKASTGIGNGTADFAGGLVPATSQPAPSSSFSGATPTLLLFVVGLIAVVLIARR